jgi:hypothetical protein
VRAEQWRGGHVRLALCVQDIGVLVRFEVKFVTGRVNELLEKLIELFHVGI